jgi:uncharacterized membrane protein HdeD (DUF308 family)
VFIRINHFGLWLGFCLVICIELCLKKQFAQLAKDAVFFCFGVALVVVGLFAYLKLNGALEYYIGDNFGAGMVRAFSGSTLVKVMLNILDAIIKGVGFISLLTGILEIITQRRDRQKRWYYIAYTVAFLATILLIIVIQPIAGHYYMLFTPFLVIAVTVCIEKLSNSIRKRNHKQWVVYLILFAIFIYPFIHGVHNTLEAVTSQTRLDSINTGELVDAHTTADDTIISLGSVPIRIYLFTHCRAASRFIYPGSGAGYVPGMRQRFLTDIQTKRPKIIVIPANGNGEYDYLPDWYKPIYGMLHTDYTILSNKNNYLVFMRRNGA